MSLWSRAQRPVYVVAALVLFVLLYVGIGVVDYHILGRRIYKLWLPVSFFSVMGVEFAFAFCVRRFLFRGARSLDLAIAAGLAALLVVGFDYWFRPLVRMAIPVPGMSEKNASAFDALLQVASFILGSACSAYWGSRAARWYLWERRYPDQYE